MLLNCGVGEESWESLGLQVDPACPSWRSVLGVHWKDSCWSWNSNTLATWCEELTHLKRLWCWERLRAGGEGDNRRWDGWRASSTKWTWVWVNYRSWWWRGRPGMLLFMGLQRIGHDWATDLNWSRYKNKTPVQSSIFLSLDKRWGKKKVSGFERRTGHCRNKEGNFQKKKLVWKVQFRYTEVKSKGIPGSADELIRSREARTKARVLFCIEWLQKREKNMQSLMTLGEFSKSPPLWES